MLRGCIQQRLRRDRRRSVQDAGRVDHRAIRTHQLDEHIRAPGQLRRGGGCLPAWNGDDRRHGIVGSRAECVVLVGHSATRQQCVKQETEYQERQRDHAAAEEREPGAERHYSCSA